MALRSRWRVTRGGARGRCVGASALVGALALRDQDHRGRDAAGDDREHVARKSSLRLRRYESRPPRMAASRLASCPRRDDRRGVWHPAVDDPVLLSRRPDPLQKDEEDLRLDAGAVLREERDLETSLVRVRPVDLEARDRQRLERIRDDRDVAPSSIACTSARRGCSGRRSSRPRRGSSRATAVFRNWRATAVVSFPSGTVFGFGVCRGLAWPTGQASGAEGSCSERARRSRRRSRPRARARPPRGRAAWPGGRTAAARCIQSPPSPF